MKVLILLGGGMPDEAIEAIGNRSPLEAAKTPNLDRIAAMGKTGMVQTIAQGREPVSETALANLLGLGSLAGRMPRGPLEALGSGRPVEEDQVAFHFNLVHLFTDYQRLILADHTAGIESDEEGRPYVESLEEALGNGELIFHHVSEYRGLMLWRNGARDLDLTPTHRILGAEIKDAMPRGERSRELDQIYNSAQMVLAAHPDNAERRNTGRTAVNSIWAYGAGDRVDCGSDFSERWGMAGGILTKSAALRGIAASCAMDVVEAPDGRVASEPWAEAAGGYLQSADVLFVHCDAGDRAAHQLNPEMKVGMIEQFDSLAGTLQERAASFGDYRMAVLADHRTSPVDGQHAAAPVPLAFCGSGVDADRGKEFDERLLVRGSVRLTDGSRLLSCLLDSGE